MVHPVMGRFVYNVNLWNGQDASILATLEGVQVQGHSSLRTTQMIVAVKDPAEVDTPKIKREEDKLSTPPTKVEWVLGKLCMPTTQTSGEDASEEMHLNMETQSASTSSPRIREALAFIDFETSDMATKDPDVKKIPEDELRHQWKDKTGQGFWPEVMECQRCKGCICWRCASGCRLELPKAIMAPILEQEWHRVMFAVGHDPVTGIGNWCDSVQAEEAEETPVYDKRELAHLYMWCKEAAAAILTVNLEMGLAHRHVEVDPCVRGTKKNTRDIYTGYFMCLAPEDEEGEEVEDQNEHAIEAISITWEEGE
jgi:hypothetical protein